VEKRELATIPLTEKEKRKAKKDLKFIKTLTGKAKQDGFRVVISGGYSTDGNLGQITKPHNDIDILLYGDEPDAADVVNNLVQEIGKEDKDFSGLQIEDKGRKDFYHAFFAKRNGSGII